MAHFYFLIYTIIRALPLPEEYWDIYSRETSVIDYFTKGEILWRENNQKAVYHKESEKQNKKLPQKGYLVQNHKHYKELCLALSTKNGNEKRIIMLSDLRDQTSLQIEALKERQESVKELGFIMAQSVYQEPEKDWAVLGGIADGIAGSAAGLSTALNAMSDNNAISARNHQRQKSAAKTILDMQVSANNMSDDIGRLSKHLLKLNTQIADARIKVALNSVLPNDLFAALKINVAVKKAKNQKSTEITGEIENTYIPKNLDVPENVKLTLDGILQVKVYFEDNLLDTFHMPLPVYGIECNGGKGEVKAYSESYIENDNDGEYKFEITPEKLWLMEL